MKECKHHVKSVGPAEICAATSADMAAAMFIQYAAATYDAGDSSPVLELVEDDPRPRVRWDVLPANWPAHLFLGRTIDGGMHGPFPYGVKGDFWEAEPVDEHSMVFKQREAASVLTVGRAIAAAVKACLDGVVVASAVTRDQSMHKRLRYYPDSDWWKVTREYVGVDDGEEVVYPDQRKVSRVEDAVAAYNQLG